MNREEQLAFCRVCVNQKKDLQRGIVCILTDEVADSEVSCESYQKDEVKEEKLKEKNVAYSLEGQLATQGQRFANYIIDYLFLIGLGALVGAALGLILGYFAPEHLDIFDQENRLLDYFYGFVIGTIYYSFFEGFTGRSIGKFFTKTKVVTEEGERPDFGAVFVRSMCRYIPFNAFSFLGADASGWHDKFSKTRVVTID
jgi:uncharacterized RDD family membrane protein YckC